MGIVNVTPDSFFPASRSYALDDAVDRAHAHLANGADVIDVGGESTRPGAHDVALDEELRRVVPVVERLAEEAVISVDTQKPAVARAAVAAGARIINDVSGTLIDVAGEVGADYVAMHRRGTATTMQDDPVYVDVVGEVLSWLEDAARRARAAGVGRLWLDPGIGFGKTVAHNLALLGALDRFVALADDVDAGVLLGTSRKRFLASLGRKELAVEERLEGSLASAAWGIACGVSMVRVHDVREAAWLRDLATRDFEAVGA